MKPSAELPHFMLPTFSQVKAISNQAGRVTFFEDGTIREESELELGGNRKTSHYLLSHRGVQRVASLKATENLQSLAVFLEIMKNEFGQDFSDQVRKRWTSERIAHERPLNGVFIASQIAQGEQRRTEKAAKKNQAVSDNSEQPTKILDSAAKSFRFTATEETIKTCGELISGMLQQDKQPNNHIAENLLKLLISNATIWLGVSESSMGKDPAKEKMLDQRSRSLSLFLKEQLPKLKKPDDVVNEARKIISTHLKQHSNISGKSLAQRRKRTAVVDCILQMLSPSILEAAHSVLSTQEGFRGTSTFEMEMCSIGIQISNDEIEVAYLNSGIATKVSISPQREELPKGTSLPEMLEKNDLVIQDYGFGEALLNLYLAGSISLSQVWAKSANKESSKSHFTFDVSELHFAYSPADLPSQAIINDHRQAREKRRKDLSHLLL